ncbi:capsular biosynthesis protein, partial [Bacillus sp. JJ1609]|uniref:capsular biosynthesis protein n=1 Tax=Bacillus sp. JJ1609 TaxID=3122977 RepID=UPI003000BDE2
VLKYYKFKKFAIEILEKKDYDFIIVWNDIAIFMFADYLAKKWKGKYCLNIRDYSGQNNRLVYLIFKHVIKNSAFTTISSDGYKKFLPKFNYIHVHSLNMEVLSNIESRSSLQSIDKPIRISFIGNIRFFDMNKKLLDIFKNDKRFVIQFFGTNANVLLQHAELNGIFNVKFHDTFQVSKTSKFIKETDLVNNLYGNGSMALDYALSIKLYHGVYNRTPILVLPNTHMARVIEKYQIGHVVESIDNSLPDKIFNWYRSIDFKIFNRGCMKLLEEINESNDNFEQVYQQYIK